MTFDHVFAEDIARLRETSRRDPIGIDAVMKALSPIHASKRQVLHVELSSAEETAAYSQARLGLLARVMFCGFVLLLGFTTGVYLAFPEVEPRNSELVSVLDGIALAALAAVWRVLLVRRQLSVTSIHAVDALLVIGTGIVFAMSSVLAHDLGSPPYFCLICVCLTILLRAVVVPSTPRRTTVIGVLACLPMSVVIIVLVYVTDQDIPVPGYVGGAALICIMSVLIAATISRVIYGLRRQAKEAARLGRYTLESKIGQGSNGVVYRAHHVLLRRPTAVKLIRHDQAPPETLERFEREVRYASMLTHPNTVAIYDYGRSSDGTLYFAMEYLDGIDLQKLVTRFGPQPADRVVPILIQICGSLAEAHGQGLIHHDVKPANVILCERGGIRDVAKVVDFGLVREIGSSGGDRLLGTPAYMAPESVTNPNGVGPPADIYALGCLAYYLISGRTVFDGRTSVDVCIQHVASMPARPSSIAGVALPQGFEDLLMRLLSKQPGDRPTAVELATELNAIPIGDAWCDEDAARWWNEFRHAQLAGLDPASDDHGSRSTASVADRRRNT